MGQKEKNQNKNGANFRSGFKGQVYALCSQAKIFIQSSFSGSLSYKSKLCMGFPPMPADEFDRKSPVLQQWKGHIKNDPT